MGRPASFMFWPVMDEGFLMRCFHLHPVLINPRGNFPDFSFTIDGSAFVQQACPDLNDLHIVDDSDDVMYFSIAPSSQSAEWIDRPKVDWRGVIRWARTMALSGHNIHYLQRLLQSNEFQPPNQKQILKHYQIHH